MSNTTNKEINKLPETDYNGIEESDREDSPDLCFDRDASSGCEGYQYESSDEEMDSEQLYIRLDGIRKILTKENYTLYEDEINNAKKCQDINVIKLSNKLSSFITFRKMFDN